MAGAKAARGILTNLMLNRKTPAAVRLQPFPGVAGHKTVIKNAAGLGDRQRNFFYSLCRLSD